MQTFELMNKSLNSTILVVTHDAVVGSYADRVFTTGSVQFPNTPYIKDENGHKDFTPLIKKALELGGYSSDQHFTGINGGTSVMTGFAKMLFSPLPVRLSMQ